MIQIQNASIALNNKTIFSHLNLEVSPGEIVFLLGRSGAGKSVLLKCIVGLLDLEEGEILVEGQLVNQTSQETLIQVRRMCGMVFQQPALIDSLTVYENIVFGLEAEKVSESIKREKAQEAIKNVGLSESLLDRQPLSLSFGAQKRISIARAMILQPKYLLLDEPTTGMDPVVTRSLIQLIQKVAKESHCGVLVVSHDLSSSREIANRIVLLHAGALVFSGDVGQFASCPHPLAQDFREASL